MKATIPVLALSIIDDKQAFMNCADRAIRPLYFSSSAKSYYFDAKAFSCYRAIRVLQLF